jgi:hypothetical protein
MALPGYMRYDSYELGRRGTTDELIPRGKRFLFRPYGETYLQLQANSLDLEDPDAIVGFANEFGLLTGGNFRFFNWLQFPSQLSFLGGIYAPRPTQDRELLSSPDERVSAFFLEEPNPGGETLEQFRLAARVIRDLVEAWRLIKGEVPPSELTWELAFAGTVRARDAPRILTRGLNSGLLSFHPRLEHLPSDRAETFALGPKTACLYEICCLELYTHIANQAVHRRCANERCRKLFVRKNLGERWRRARTKGVKYCSDRCENAQLQRESRRRRANAPVDSTNESDRSRDVNTSSSS